ncbi:MAG: hypothetical protein ACRCUP_01265 [Mycoplasmatales bacterium]
MRRKKQTENTTRSKKKLKQLNQIREHFKIGSLTNDLIIDTEDNEILIFEITKIEDFFKMNDNSVLEYLRANEIKYKVHRITILNEIKFFISTQGLSDKQNIRYRIEVEYTDILRSVTGDELFQITQYFFSSTCEKKEYDLLDIIPKKYKYNKEYVHVNDEYFRFIKVKNINLTTINKIIDTVLDITDYELLIIEKENKAEHHISERLSYYENQQITKKTKPTDKMDAYQKKAMIQKIKSFNLMYDFYFIIKSERLEEIYEKTNHLQNTLFQKGIEIDFLIRQQKNVYFDYLPWTYIENQTQESKEMLNALQLDSVEDNKIYTTNKKKITLFEFYGKNIFLMSDNDKINEITSLAAFFDSLRIRFKILILDKNEDLVLQKNYINSLDEINYTELQKNLKSDLIDIYEKTDKSFLSNKSFYIAFENVEDDDILLILDSAFRHDYYIPTNQETLRIIHQVFKMNNNSKNIDLTLNGALPSFIDYQFNSIVIDGLFRKTLSLRVLPKTSEQIATLSKIINITGLNLSIQCEEIPPRTLLTKLNAKLNYYKSIINTTKNQKDTEKADSIYNMDIINSALQQLQSENRAYLLFDITFDIVAWSKTELDKKLKILENNLLLNGLEIDYLIRQQDKGLSNILFWQFNRLNQDLAQVSSSLALSSLYPFQAAKLLDEKGFFLGYEKNGDMIVCDIFNNPNATNSSLFIVGKPGMGKSMTFKTLMCQMSLRDIKMFVLDMENKEYDAVKKSIGGSTITPLASKINPLQVRHELNALEVDEYSINFYDDVKLMKENLIDTNSYITWINKWLENNIQDLDVASIEKLNEIITSSLLKTQVTSDNIQTIKDENFPNINFILDEVEYFWDNDKLYKSQMDYLLKIIEMFTANDNLSIHENMMILDERKEKVLKNQTVKEHVIWLKNWFKIYNPEFNNTELAIFEKILLEMYDDMNISTRTLKEKKATDFPIFSDLYNYLKKFYDEGRINIEVYEKIEPQLFSLTIGSDSNYFNGHTNFDIEKGSSLFFDMFAIQSLTSNLKFSIMYNYLTFIWSYCTNEKNMNTSKALFLDEVHLLINRENGFVAGFVTMMQKRSRKYKLALLTATQNINDFKDPAIQHQTVSLISNPEFKLIYNVGEAEMELLENTLNLTSDKVEIISRSVEFEGLLSIGSSQFFHTTTSIPDGVFAMIGTMGRS